MGILGIDLGGTNVRAGLVEGYSLIKVESLPVTKDGNENEVLNDIFNLINHYPIEEISAIGIGVPSVVDVEKGIVYEVQNIPSWKKVHLKEILVKKYKKPVYINNDANCFVVGEKYFGKGKDYKNIVGLIVGTGLGAGVIINDKLYEGKNCGAGEFGMIPYKGKNYEYYCSGQFFLNEYNSSGEELFNKAKLGDKEAANIFSGFGANLGEVIKVIMYAVDPEMIILGGSVSKAYRFFNEGMYKSINDFAYTKSVDNLQIEVSEIDNIAILGAAALYYNYKRSAEENT